MPTKNHAPLWAFSIAISAAFMAVATPVNATPPIEVTFPDPAPSGPNAEPETTTRLIVYYRSNASGRAKGAVTPSSQNAAVPAIRSEFSAAEVRPLLGAVSIASAQQVAAEIARDPTVRAVLVDRRISRHGTISSNDSLNYTMWNLGLGDPGTSATEPVWPSGKGSGVTVAVLDTGMLNHPDMVGVWNTGYDLISDAGLAGDGGGRDADATDTMACDDGSGAQVGTPHGLMVASVIAARWNNNEGIAGVAPLSNITPVRVISSCGGWLSDVLDGMRWAAGLSVSGLPVNANPAKVLNLSLGTTSPGVACSPTVQSIVDEVRATGAVVIVSSGNDGADSISVPAACNGVIAVTASTKAGKRASYGNAGAGTTLAAPGGGCVAGAPSSCTSNAFNFVPVASQSGSTSNYVMTAGTSFSAPHVSGAAALLLERDGTKTPDEIQSVLVNSARAFAAGGCDGGLCGAGMLDVNGAINSSGYSLSATISASTARAGSVVSMTATASADALSPTFSWQQTVGSTVSLALSNGDRTATFTAPSANALFAFKVTSTDNSALQRHATVSTQVSIAPVLTPVSPITVEPGTEVRQTVTLSSGGTPQALSVDSGSQANGVTIDGSQVVWSNTTSGNYQIAVTPYDNVGAGEASTIEVSVGGDSATSSEGGGGGGAIGAHGLLLLMLAWAARRRWS